MLRRLAERHELLPERMVISGDLEVSEEIVGCGGFSDVRRGRYLGKDVAVKTMRVTPQDKIEAIRKVSVNGVFAPIWGFTN